MTTQTGTLIGIARREASRAPMEELRDAEVTLEQGVAGDSRGRRRPRAHNDRQVTLMSAEAWAQACEALGAELAWTVRRANLLVEGLALADTEGARITLGELELEVTEECDPCARMDEQHAGLTAALTPDWRGGVACRILRPGRVRLGDAVRLTPA